MRDPHSSTRRYIPGHDGAYIMEACLHFMFTTDEEMIANMPLSFSRMANAWSNDACMHQDVICIAIGLSIRDLCYASYLHG